MKNRLFLKFKGCHLWVLQIEVARANILQAVYRQVLPDIQLKDASGSPEVKGPGSSPGHILSAQKNAIGGEKLPN